MKHKYLRTMSIFLCVQHSYLPIPAQLISIYLSPQCLYVYFTKRFDDLMKDYYDVTYYYYGTFQYEIHNWIRTWP